MDKNTQFKRTIVVGDVHGCLTELKALLDKVQFDPGADRLIVAGDLVDRGPDSAGVVRFVREHGECVLGNHEGKLLRRARHLARARRDKNYRNPMKPDLDQEYTIQNLSQDDLNWLSELPGLIRLPENNAIIVHAGMTPGRDPETLPLEILTMVRFISESKHMMLPLLMPGFRQPPQSVYWAEVYDGPEDVLFGHNVVGRGEPKTWNGSNSRGACHGIDTGCVFGGKLTAVLLEKDEVLSERETLRFVQVDALEEYASYNKFEE